MTTSSPVGSTSMFSNSTSNFDPDLSWQMVLADEQAELYLKLPTFIMLGVLMLIGIPGNLLVLIVYRLKMKYSAYRVFVLWMAAFDLLNCLVGIPFEMVDLRNDVTLDNAAACKIFRFMIFFCACGSVSILVAVSVDRYRRVCKPYAVQLTVTYTWVVSALFSLIALAAAIPALVFYGVKTEEKFGVVLRDCSIDDSWGPPYKSVIIYQVVLAAIFILSILILAIVYTLIIFAIQRQNERMRKMSETYSIEKEQNRTPTTNPTCRFEVSQNAVVEDESGADQVVEQIPQLNSTTNNNSHVPGNNSAHDERRDDITGINLSDHDPVRAQTKDLDTDKEHILLVPTSQSACTASRHDEADIPHGKTQGTETNKRGSAITAAFMRLFSRDVNPLNQAKSPTKQKPEDPRNITQQNSGSSEPIPLHKSNGSEPISTVWENEDSSEPVWHCTDREETDSLDHTQRFHGKAPHLFIRQESLTNYYPSVTNTPNDSIDDAPRSDCENNETGDQRLACEASMAECSSWDAFNSSEDVDSHQTLNISGSLGPIKPLAGNLQRKCKTSGFEVAVASVEFHHGAKDSRVPSMLSVSQSCSVIGSENVSRESSSSRVVQWGSINARTSASVSSNPNLESGIPKLQWVVKPETRNRKLGHNDEPVRLCVSDYLPLDENKASRCSVCRDCSSLPSLTREHHQQELCLFTIKRAFSVPSLPSLAGISTCSYKCGRKYAVRNTNIGRDCGDEVQTSYAEISPGPDQHQDSNTNSATFLQVQRENIPQSLKPSFVNTNGPESSLDVNKCINDTPTCMSTNTPLASNSEKTQSSGMSTTKLTYTMLGVTLGFVVSYLPHLALQIYRGLQPGNVESLLRTSSVYFAFYHLCNRSFFVNNAINPIIYSFMNKTFQRKSLSLLRSWATAAFNEGQWCEKFCPRRFWLWARRDLSVTSSRMEETG